MGAFNIILSGVILFLFLLIIMQPLIILGDVARDLKVANNPVKYGTDSQGTVVPVGDSFFGLDFTTGLLAAIGLAMVVGFIVWASKGGRDQFEEFEGGF